MAIPTPGIDSKLREGRTARCHCGATRPSTEPGLAFYAYRGPGSAAAEEHCTCGFHKCAHERQPRLVDPRSVQERGDCTTGFVAHGPHEFDEFYCGCRGWD
jgi:hypothetical protein